MAPAQTTMPPRSFGQTMRVDAWWAQPLLVFLGLGRVCRLFDLGGVSGNALLFRALSFAVLFAGDFWRLRRTVGSGPNRLGGRRGCCFRRRCLILWAPGGFRLTCYYYRGAYYKAFWADPPACTVGEPRKTYLGERSFPLIMQNVHRYFLYLALLFILVLALRCLESAVVHRSGDGQNSFGIGVGTIVLAINVVLLGGYTFGCHSLRHLVGGFRRSIFEIARRYQAYRCVSCFNRRHMLWAWMSLFWVGVLRPLRSPLLDGHLARLEICATDCRFLYVTMTANVTCLITKHSNTTFSSSARAGRDCARRSKRRRREFPSDSFANRFSAKRTRSWPKAGSRPRSANVDDRDNWKVHFADTMRGGQYVNNWRMAELHAKEAPDRVRELEAWGAVFDRTKDGRILQRNFGGHKYPRLAHVGDRTGSGDDPHAAGSRHSSGNRCPHGAHAS